MKPLNKPKIFLAFPAYGRTNITDTTASLFELGVTFGMNGLYGGFGTASHTDIAEVRNVFLTMFMDRTDSTHLLMVDADMRFRAALVIEMLKYDQPVVGVVYRKKMADLEWVGRALQGETPITNGFMEMAGVGAGLLLIRRDCVLKMLGAFPELIDIRPPDKQLARVQIESGGLKRVFKPFNPIDNTDGDPLSEDLAFCERWRSIGGKVYANVSHEVGHIGLTDFGGSYEKHLVKALNAA